ncbi:LysR family transcriptional regulator [Pelagibius sp. Alg239-R121]|uniref:LysR family transcriptional regulator n=1 Tax=Pelagibius sp. Alg239-R121 TaxID=2993448 RepID=UPI0024A67883|nr:LysR family transcriptional regulator [Pelagibius sp. Alg239-R121]
MALHLVPRSLQYIENVAQIGSIQGTSRELGISASAIDRQILILEETLGVKLFERKHNGMTPTAAGELLIVMARRWRRDAETLRAEVKQMQGVDLGHVKIATMDSQVNGVLPKFVEELAQELPRVTLEIEIANTTQAVAALEQGTADIAFVFNAPRRKDLHLIWSEDLPFGCVTTRGHPLAQRESLTLEDVVRYPIALQSRALAIRQYLDLNHGWLFSNGNQPMVTNSLQLVKQLALLGGHVALTSELDAAPEILEERLVFTPVRDKTAAPQSVGVLINSRRTLPRVTQTVAGLLSENVSRFLLRAREVNTSISQ